MYQRLGRWSVSSHPRIEHSADCGSHDRGPRSDRCVHHVKRLDGRRVAHWFYSCSEVRDTILLIWLHPQTHTNPLSRLIFGVHGSYIGILIRVLLSIIWYGSQAWLGGLCVTVILSSWSHSFLVMENTLPASANMVTRDLIGFLLFHIISIPLLVRQRRPRPISK